MSKEKKEEEEKKKDEKDSGKQVRIKVSLQRAKRILQAMKSSHGELVSSLESFVETITSPALQIPAQQLLKTRLCQLLNDAYEYGCQQYSARGMESLTPLSLLHGLETAISEAEKYHEDLQQQIAGKQRCFSSPSQDKMLAAFPSFIKLLLGDLKAMTQDQPSGAVTMAEEVKLLQTKCTLRVFTGLLQRTVLRLHSSVEYGYWAGLNDLGPLLRECPHLISGESGIEIPGQYEWSGRYDIEPISNRHLLIDRIRFSSRLVDNGVNVLMRGDDGALYPFTVQRISDQSRESSEQRLYGVFRLANRIFGRSNETQRRDCALRLLTFTPLGQHRLVQTDAGVSNLAAIYESQFSVVQDATGQRYSASFPLMCTWSALEEFANRLHMCHAQVGPAAATSTLPSPDVATLSRHVFDNFMKPRVPHDMLTKFFWKRTASHDALYALREEFVKQYALYALLSYLFALPSPNPERQQFSATSLRFLPADLVPTYQQHLLESKESVPFRLTPNIASFFGPICIEGPFTAVLAAGTMALASFRFRESLRNYLALFLAEDLLHRQWAESLQRKQFCFLPPLQPATDQRLKDQTNHNLTLIFKRLDSLAPRLPTASQPQQHPIHQSPIHHPISQLIEEAQSLHNQISMPVTWQPWL